MDRGAWWAVVLGVAKSPTQLSDYELHFTFIGRTEGTAGPRALWSE